MITCEQILKTDKVRRLRNQLEVKFNLKPNQPLTDKTINIIIPLNLKQQTEEKKCQGKKQIINYILGNIS